MPTSQPPRLERHWQLPWLRLSLILRRMEADRDTHPDDVAELCALRTNLAQRGWFN